MKILLISLLWIALSAPSVAYADEPAAMSAEAEIIALDDAWIEAEVSGDRSALESILHEDFLVTYPSGRTVDRTTFVDGVLRNRPAPFTVTHDSIQVHGDTASIIDVSGNGEIKFTWIAIKRDNQWRVISETASRVETH